MSAIVTFQKRWIAVNVSGVKQGTLNSMFSFYLGEDRVMVPTETSISGEYDVLLADQSWLVFF